MKTEVTTFCCGLSLKTGTIIIGTVQSIFAFIFLVLSAAYAEHPHELIDMSDAAIVPEVHTLKAILITIAVASGFLCVFSILLIFGAETNRPLLLLPWLVLNPIVIAIYIITTLIALIHHGGINSGAFIAGHLIVGIICCVVGAYKILAVYSLYKNLKRLNF